jgi:hypothetical protein
MPDPLFNQEDTGTGVESPAAIIAVLRERISVMGREIRELKDLQRRELEEVRAGQRELSKQMQTILDALAERRGSWKAVVTIGSVAATIGAVAGWLVQQWIAIKHGG